MFLQILIPILFGTYGNNIYTADFDTQTRTFSNIASAPALDASFIIKDDDGYFAVSENGDTPGAYTFSPDGGTLLAACVFSEFVHVFAINEDGELIPANTRLKLGEDRPTCVQTGYQK